MDGLVDFSGMVFRFNGNGMAGDGWVRMHALKGNYMSWNGTVNLNCNFSQAGSGMANWV